MESNSVGILRGNLTVDDVLALLQFQEGNCVEVIALLVVNGIVLPLITITVNIGILFEFGLSQPIDHSAFVYLLFVVFLA